MLMHFNVLNAHILFIQPLLSAEKSLPYSASCRLFGGGSQVILEHPISVEPTDQNGWLLLSKTHGFAPIVILSQHASHLTTRMKQLLSVVLSRHPGKRLFCGC